MAERTCRCGAEITPHPRERNPKLWCTAACRQRHKRRDLDAYREAERIRVRLKNRVDPQEQQARARRRSAHIKLARAARGTTGPTWANGSCHRCGCPFTAQVVGHVPRYCSRACARADLAGRRRMRKRNAYVAPVFRRKVFERDGWTCQICRRPVVRGSVVPNLRAPTLDHIIPLARGGTHEPSNVQLACFECNSRKSDTIRDQQLLLFG